MVSRKHQQYRDQAHRRGYSTEQADEALERVRADPSAESGYVTDLYERALMRLDMGDPTAQGCADAEQILADRGMGQAPAEVRDVIAQMLDRMGLTVDEQGRPAQAFPQMSVNNLDDLFADLAGEMAEPEEHQRAEQIRPHMLQVLAERPGQWLVMAQIGQAAQIGPEEAVALRLALESLSQAGHIEQGPEEYGQGPTWRARPQKEEQEEEQLPGSQVHKGHRPASLDQYTFVLPAAVSQLDYQVPFLVLAVSRAEDLARIPLPTSLHHMHGEVLPLAHADMLIEEVGPIPATQEWMDAVTEFDDCARVVVLCEPAPTHIDEETTPLTEALFGTEVPAWAGALVAGKMHAVTRQVPVSRGQDPLSIGMDPSAPSTLPGWAHQTITP